MCQTIENGICNGRITYVSMPFRRRQLACYYKRSCVESVIQNIKKILSALSGHWI